MGDPRQNVDSILEAIAPLGEADLILLPELGLTGYTCADLFAQLPLLDAAEEQLLRLAEQTASSDQLVVVGMPLRAETSLMNAAIAMHRGRLIAAVPKQFLPTYKEFYEGRWFRAGDAGDGPVVTIAGQQVPYGTDLLLRYGEAVIGMEICEDLWTPLPPSSFQAVAGANVLLNLSASNEVVGKAQWRRDLVVSQSGRCIAGYVYASSGPTESTTDLVFGGHCMIAENGQLLDQSRRVGDGELPWQGATHAMADIDLQRLQHDRQVIGSFDDGRRLLPHPFRFIDVKAPDTGRQSSASSSESDTATPSSGSRVSDHRSPDRPPLRRVIAQPFVPSDPSGLAARCAEIFEIQTAALAKRVSRLSASSPLVIGVSGGLDSTLALLVAVKACDQYDWPRSRIHGVTMPGFGTTASTESNATELMRVLGISSERIDIRELSLQAFRSLDHAPLGIALTEGMDAATLQQRLVQTDAGEGDLVFENVQARLRTFLLMSRGFVLGTGDLSEQALGWSTYNGDHMSMYNVNTSIPKTLVRFLVRYAADHYFQGRDGELLHAIADTPISPELLPPAEDGTIRQETEDTLGPYELHDFFLYHVVRNGFTPEKILFLARHAQFSQAYPAEQIEKTLETFYRRFFANQFKRSCVPDGPKVGSVSLSPRGDWRMPSDADRGPWKG